jgi:hypothetical protein
MSLFCRIIIFIEIIIPLREIIIHIPLKKKRGIDYIFLKKTTNIIIIIIFNLFLIFF